MIRAFYERALRPLSPYGADSNMPEYRLLIYVKDGVLVTRRLYLFGMWIAIGAVLALAFGFIPFLHLRQHSTAATLCSIAAILYHKIVMVWEGRYKADPLDWCADAIGAGGAGAYLMASLTARQAPDWRVLLALVALWLLTYPWSTPARPYLRLDSFAAIQGIRSDGFDPELHDE